MNKIGESLKEIKTEIANLKQELQDKEDFVAELEAQIYLEAQDQKGEVND